LLLCLGGFALAQEAPRLEVFGGYSLEHISACGAPGDAFLTCSQFIETGQSSPSNFQGWDASITRYVFKFVGVTADFSGHYGTTTIRVDSASDSRFSFMFGPTATIHRHAFSLFGHALFGALFNRFGTFSIPNDSESQETATVPTYTKFAWALGGGVDANVSRHFAVRLGQFDYERVNVPSVISTSYPAVGGFRYSAGVVFKH
jgi:opacity protein-like surface antigen